MGKISPVSAKYIVHSTIAIDGVVDRPDVIGAIFGQTEGLLGADLELRELQRSGRIGRIEVNTETRNGKTGGTIIVPSSLDKAETSIIAAALEIIQRIGPCNAKIRVDSVEDVRVTKRGFVIERAKELLKQLMDDVMPDSQELADEVMFSVRVMEVREYGNDRLPAGPMIDESDEVIVVEGRADVLNLLKQGIKNSISLNGTSVPQTIIDLSKKKIITAFVDGDRGGDLIIKELLEVADIDYVTKAPDGKEVEEITKKEIHKALRSRISAEQARFEINPRGDQSNGRRGEQRPGQYQDRRPEPRPEPRPEAGQERNEPLAAKKPDFISQEKKREFPPERRPEPFQDKRPMPPPIPTRKDQKPAISLNERKTFKDMSEDLIGTRGAYILDEKLNILGKVPMTELNVTITELNSAYAIVFDGSIDKDLVKVAEKANVQYLVAMDAKQKPETKINLLTIGEL